MTRRIASLTALMIALLPLVAAAAAAPAPAPGPAPVDLGQFLASLQPPADAPPAAFSPQSLSPLAGARPAAGCGCQAQHQQCCLQCSGNNFCSHNAGCQSACGDALQQCNCQ